MVLIYVCVYLNIFIYNFHILYWRDVINIIGSNHDAINMFVLDERQRDGRDQIHVAEFHRCVTGKLIRVGIKGTRMGIIA